MLHGGQTEFTYNSAMKSNDKDKWKTAWYLFVSMTLFEFADLPPGRKTLGHRSVLMRKDDGRYKARLAAQGFLLIEVIEISYSKWIVEKLDSIVKEVMNKWCWLFYMLLLVMSKRKDHMEPIKETLKKNFKMKDLEVVNKYLGINVEVTEKRIKLYYKIT